MANWRCFPSVLEGIAGGCFFMRACLVAWQIEIGIERVAYVDALVDIVMCKTLVVTQAFKETP